MRRFRVHLLLVVLTVIAAWVSIHDLRLSSDLTDLFPNRGEAAMLTRFLRAFGGGDLAVVLVKGDDPHDVEMAARRLTEELSTRSTVKRVLAEAPLPRAIDPTETWRYAGPAGEERLARALTEEGMRARLHDTKELLLAPGSGDAEAWLSRDPLRLSLIPWEGETELAAGLHVAGDGAFVNGDGRARLVIAEPRGSAFDGEAASRFVDEAHAAMSAAVQGHEKVTMELSGGHAIAVATADMIRRDLIVSGTLSTVLASCMFLFTFARARALAAVLPPLALGTLWTMGLAVAFPGGLSAIATAFAAVVIGVGVDTGVHVYAALLEGRHRGLSPREAAVYARHLTWRPTLLAAVAAGLAFASLALSELTAIRQLGLMCGAGEVLTALAILLITPEIGILLERKPPPPARTPRWANWILDLTATRQRAYVALSVAFAIVVASVAIGWPSSNDAIVAIRPRALAPLRTQQEIYRLFGGREGQWIVVSADPDADRALAAADRVAAALDPLARTGVVGFDALSDFVPALATQRARLAQRDALNLPSLAPRLQDALVAEGFDAEACAPALEAFRHPSSRLVPFADQSQGPLGWLISRHVAREGDDTLAVIYVRPDGDPAHEAAVLAAIHTADPHAVVTGYHHLEVALRATLRHDLPLVLLVAVVLVILTLRAVLRRPSHVLLALATIVVEVAAVALAMRLLHLRWHVYDALVLPVLIGITMDESMFLLHAAQRPLPGDDGSASASALPSSTSEHSSIAQAIYAQGPLVAATALTTAAGFAALLACKFEGLFDLGAVGALGSVFGLASALVVVPAGLRLAQPRSAPHDAPP